MSAPAQLPLQYEVPQATHCKRVWPWIWRTMNCGRAFRIIRAGAAHDQLGRSFSPILVGDDHAPVLHDVTCNSEGSMTATWSQAASAA
jgi:hypothetical protein